MIANRFDSARAEDDKDDPTHLERDAPPNTGVEEKIATKIRDNAVAAYRS